MALKVFYNEKNIFDEVLTALTKSRKTTQFLTDARKKIGKKVLKWKKKKQSMRPWKKTLVGHKKKIEIKCNINKRA